MPTGYTTELSDGEQSFEEFVLSCARGMGALITMRDHPRDAPIPDEFTPHTDWHDEGLAKAQARLAEIRGWDTEALIAAHAAARGEVQRYRAEDAVRRRAIRARYEAMVARVEEWMPPTKDHDGLKDFMLDQLRESIWFDCNPISYPDVLTDDPADWLEKEIARAERDVAYHTEQREEEIGRAHQRTLWVRALKASLGIAMTERSVS